MRYSNIQPASFLRRPNRFVAEVEMDGRIELVHVKNTGRCAELLQAGNRVWLVKSDNPQRRTAYDLVAVEKRVAGGMRLVNMDSMAPNRAAAEWLAAGGLGPLEDLRAEVTVGAAGCPVAIEVKGCTLEEGGIARFPDAPTLRGLKHVRGLTALSRQGWRCALLIVIQMKGVTEFRPNWATQPAFGEALIEAREAGVEIHALDCRVVPGTVEIDAPVRVNLVDERQGKLNCHVRQAGFIR